jgi:sterol 3beta-glucosyltransferase
MASAAEEAKGVEEGGGGASANGGDNPATATASASAAAAASSSSPADDRGLPRSSTMPGGINNVEITNETAGPSNLERSRTERRRQNNPADDPTKQLFDDKISLKKKVRIT